MSSPDSTRDKPTMGIAARWGFVTAMVAGLTAGCASTEMTVDTSAVKVYDKRPACRYDSLGPVTGRDGSLPKQDAGNFVQNAYGRPANEELALQRLKIAALNKGAGGVVIIRRDVTNAPVSKSGRGAQRRPGSLIVYKGIAISGCSDG